MVRKGDAKNHEGEEGQIALGLRRRQGGGRSRRWPPKTRATIASTVSTSAGRIGCRKVRRSWGLDSSTKLQRRNSLKATLAPARLLSLRRDQVDRSPPKVLYPEVL